MNKKGGGLKINKIVPSEEKRNISNVVCDDTVPILEDVKEGLDDLKRGKDLIDHILKTYPSESKISKLIEYSEVLFDKFSPFHTFDRVKLKKNIPISSEKNYGWMPYAYLLKKGAEGKIFEMDYYNDEFQYAVVFDEDVYSKFMIAGSYLTKIG